MKNNSGSLRNLFLPRFRVIAGLAIIAALALLSSGCSKAKKPGSETPAPAPENVTPIASEPAPVTASTSATDPSVIAKPSAEPDLAELNRSLMRWIMGHRRAPANFAEFSATAGVTIPPAPAGKKYAIGKDMHIQLVNQ